MGPPPVLMGDTGSRRSNLVSRLPIFRRSISRRQDSLPSTPLPYNTRAIHTSSPSSTNSSSDSAGKRRSIFRTPSLSFHHKKECERKADTAVQTNSIPNGVQSPDVTGQNLDLDQHAKIKSRHSIGFSSSRSKKITRSVTEDFEKRKEPSTNRNVFTNCISSGNDGDDSGYAEEPSQRPPKRSSRKLLPKSFSSHHRFSKTVSQSQSAPLDQQSTCSPQAEEHVELDPTTVKCSLPCSTETTERPTSLLLSPLPSTDHTTAPETPSEGLLFIDDSISETDVLPNSGSTHCYTEDFGQNVSTSQIFLNPAAAAAATVHRTKILDQSKNTSPRRVSAIENQSWEPVSPRRDYTKTLAAYQGKVLLPISELPTADASSIGDLIPADETVSNIGDATLNGAPTAAFALRNGEHFETPENSPKKQDFSESPLQRAKTEQEVNPHTILEHRINSCPSDPTQPVSHHGHHSRVNYASSLSPYREGRFVERRLRSSSEGTAGGSRMGLKPKEGHSDDQNSLQRHRASSTSSKMNSMDVLNNLGSCELDEDDLMLDLEFLEDRHHHRSVCREDSFQSIVSCSSIVFSSVEQPADSKKVDEELRMPGVAKKNFSLNLSKDLDQGEPKCPRSSHVSTSPSVDWPFPILEDSVGLEALPFRLMMQDCTSVKTLLLKMKRILQESTDMSPCSSHASLPISPIAEKPYPFKDIMKDECSMLRLQLKERDELICQLREELESARHAQMPFAHRLDKSTQTEFVGHDAVWSSADTDGSIYKAIRPVHCFQHYQINTNIWTQDAFH